MKERPATDARMGREALAALLKERSPLAALEVVHAHLGDTFEIPLPGFRPFVLVGPDNNRLVLISERDKLLWRNDNDPVARLLRHGLLVEDGGCHDALHATIVPFLQRGQVVRHIEAMWRYTDAMTADWTDGQVRDMLVEMRRVALVIVMGTLFDVDLRPDLDRLWPAILRTLQYIGPGLWIVWPRVPRLGYRGALDALDTYLYRIIRERRQRPGTAGDLLTHLVGQAGMDNPLIRDQLLTLLIAGHDTSTAALAWTLYLLGRHPSAMQHVRAEVDAVLADAPPAEEHLADLVFLDRVIKESLRLYPPIHVGNRRVATPIDVGSYTVPPGTRLMYSIYLSHRSPRYWENPAQFMPERFAQKGGGAQDALTYVPFGGGPRHCIGAAFAQVELKVVLARILQRFDLEWVTEQVYRHMGATLEPHPGVRMRVSLRKRRRAVVSMPVPKTGQADGKEA